MGGGWGDGIGMHLDGETHSCILLHGLLFLVQWDMEFAAASKNRENACGTVWNLHGTRFFG